VRREELQPRPEAGDIGDGAHLPGDGRQRLTRRGKLRLVADVKGRGDADHSPDPIDAHEVEPFAAGCELPVIVAPPSLLQVARRDDELAPGRHEHGRVEDAALRAIDELAIQERQG